MDLGTVKAMMGELAPVIRDYVGKSLSPVMTRLDGLERRLSELPVPVNGKDADPDVTAGVVFLRLEPELKEIRAKLEELPPQLEILVESKVSELPKAKDGEPGKDGLPGPSGEKGADGLPGRDGVGLAEVFEDKDGNVIVTLADGRAKALGVMRGKDGSPGKDGRDGKDAEPPSIELMSVPDDLAHNVALAVKMMAEMPNRALATDENKSGNINIHMPNFPESVVNLSVPEKSTVVNVSTPDQPAPVVHVAPAQVNVHVPKRRKEVTKVTGWDAKGRITSFEKEEIER